MKRLGFFSYLSNGDVKVFIFREPGKKKATMTLADRKAMSVGVNQEHNHFSK